PWAGTESVVHVQQECAPPSEATLVAVTIDQNGTVHAPPPLAHRLAQAGVPAQNTEVTAGPQESASSTDQHDQSCTVDLARAASSVPLPVVASNAQASVGVAAEDETG